MVKQETLLKEAVFKAVRSGGKGGQHVNKVSSKVELAFDIVHSPSLTEEQKKIILEKLKKRISDEGILRLTSDSERSQFSNKELVSKKFVRLISGAFERKKKRIATKPSLKAKEKRLEVKKRISEKKKQRSKTGLD